jgi:hypothetical protein
MSSVDIDPRAKEIELDRAWIQHEPERAGISQEIMRKLRVFLTRNRGHNHSAMPTRRPIRTVRTAASEITGPAFTDREIGPLLAQVSGTGTSNVLSVTDTMQ